MQHIVEPTLTPARWQVAVDLGAIALVVALLTVMAVAGALQVQATGAIILAAVFGLGSLLTVATLYSKFNAEN